MRVARVPSFPWMSSGDRLLSTALQATRFNLQNGNSNWNLRGAAAKSGTIQQVRWMRCLGTRCFSTTSPGSSSTPPSKEDEKLQEAPVWKQLMRESMNIPNALTFTRLLTTPGLAYLIWIDKFELAIVACFFTGVLDYFDGYFARKWKQHTVLGSFLDPLADKVFVGALFGTLTAKGLFPLPLAALVIGRDVALLGGSFIYRGLTKPKDVPFFATTGKGVIEVKPTLLSKVNTVLQMSVMGFALTKAAYGIPNAEVFNAMCWVVGGTTLMSGLDYANMQALRQKGREAMGRQ